MLSTPSSNIRENSKFKNFAQSENFGENLNENSKQICKLEFLKNNLSSFLNLHNDCFKKIL